MALVVVFDGGGFSAASQWLFVVGGGCVALVLGASLISQEYLAHTQRHWSVRPRSVFAAVGATPLVLALLSAVTLLSAMWSITGSSGPLRIGLVTAGLALLSGVPPTLTGLNSPGLRACAATLIVLAAVAQSALGLVSACLRLTPTGLWLGGAWRPAGSFQYPSALALLAAMALPALAVWPAATGPRRFARALAIAVLGAALGAAAERLEIVLAAAALAAALVPTLRPPRCSVGHLAEAMLLTVWGAVAGRVLVSFPEPAEAAADGGALLTLAVVLMVLPAALTAAGPRIERVLARNHRKVGELAGVATLLLVSATIVGVLVGAHSGTPATGGITHGRTSQWTAAIDTWMHWPVLGSGAGTYLVASLPYQTGAVAAFPHCLPLELAAELGIPGLILALALYGAAARTLWTTRNSPGWILLGPAVVMFLVSNLLDWTWHLTGLTAIWCLAVGALAVTRDGSGEGARAGAHARQRTRPARR